MRIEARTSRELDFVSLPPESAFRGAPEYAATAMHELGHWTGRPSHFNRDMKARFGSKAHAMASAQATSPLPASRPI